MPVYRPRHVGSRRAPAAALICNRGATVSGGSVRFFCGSGPPKTLTGGGLWNEALDRLSAGRRNLAGVGDKATADALSVRDELRADRQGVCHAGPFVGWGFGVLGLGLLRLGSDDGGSERHAEGH